jgi:glycosyltransferase involved in cell wall biosynthesis
MTVAYTFSAGRPVVKDRGTRLRVLMSAYACQPGKGSEFGVGWNQVQQSARFHDVWVITRLANREAIENELPTQPRSNVRWIYFDLPYCVRFWKLALSVRLYYYAWQLAAYWVASKLHRRVGFDVAHHVTFVNYCSPTFLALLPIPFVWGPVGGGESAPYTFRKWLGLRGRTLEAIRNLVRRIGEIDPFVRITARRSAVALATTPETQVRLSNMGCKRVEVISEAGLPAHELHKVGLVPPPGNGSFRVVTVGRLLYWKGIEIGLRAFAKFHRSNPDSEYWIIGDGSERVHMERLAQSMGIGKAVVFFGQMSRSEVSDRIALCDVMLFPSLHDSGGWVCLEAMAARRPVVCLDLGGPGLQVTSEVGIKIPAISPTQAIADIAKALDQLAVDPLRRKRLGEAGRTRVQRHFNWDRKGEQFADLYSSLASPERERPSGLGWVYEQC